MKKIIFLLYGIIFSHIGLIKAQSLELPKNIQSPNASSLGKYGDIPMDLFTGRARVNISLYSINEGNIPLDISLNYDTGGVRVNDVPGWVGQNWALNAGGVITRTQRGKGHDEGKTCSNGSGNPDSNWGYLFYRSDLQAGNWSDGGNIRNLVHNYMNTYGNSKDYEPDIFTFNFMGKTGKFFLGEDGGWKVSSKDNLKVEINESDYFLPLNVKFFGGQTANSWKRCPSIGKIKISDDEGNYYIFGKTQNDIEYTINSYDHQSELSLYSSAWYLSEVYNKFGTKIYSFQYERGDDQGQLFVNAGWKFLNRDACGVYGACGQTLYNQTEAWVAGNLIKPCYLTKIITNKGMSVNLSSVNHNSLKYKADDPIIYRTNYRQSEYYNHLVSIGQANQAWYMFNYYFWYSIHTPINNGDPMTENTIYQTGNYLTSLGKIITEWKWRKLNNIIIKDENNITLKTVNFNFNDDPTKRLKLQKVTIDNQFKYSFDYNNLESLPTFCSQAFDHLGYYNGNNYDVNVVDQTNHYANRQTNENYVKYGTLSKITYPLGGYTTFEYEPHKYSSNVSNDKASLINESGIIGGVRIKRVTDFSDPNNKVIKDYLYQNDIANNTPNGILLLKNLYNITNFAGKTDCGSNFYETSFSMNSIVPLSNFSGTHIEYPVVIEKRSDENGNSIGYTKNNYTSYIDYKDSFVNTIQLSFSIFDPKTDFSFKRGLLRKKSIFDVNNILKYEEELTYDITGTKKVRALSYDIFGTCFLQGMPGIPNGQPDGNPGLKGTAYEIYYSDFNGLTKKTRTYGNGGQFLETIENNSFIDYGSFGDNFLKNKSYIDNDGKNISENYIYSFDKNGTEPYTSLTNRREFSIVETSKLADQEVLEKTKTDYALVPTVDISGNPITSQIFPQKISNAKGNNVYEEKLVIDKYDIDGHILKAHKTNGNYIYYYYGYNNRYPILKIEGSEISDETAILGHLNTLKSLLNTASPDYTQIKQQQSNIINSLPNHMCTLYTFKPNYGVSSVRNSSGIIEYYNYDNIGRLINVKDQSGKLVKSYSYEIKNQ
ncbi:hypothetical protein HNP38_002297 [Chryseobacterium defluvii]|uniref:YD repeat-containing protein n=1 Tax=Chryseobacterium defluvii TaxID=160396 RepID=A0A840KC80_9FLAO|nr:hypothetical protein [Chryseobacterium defluvii]MBB4807001.1 hypothetical protein [Chryseobacterium defluvii]